LKWFIRHGVKLLTFEADPKRIFEQLAAEQLLVPERGIAHDVEALEEIAFLLTRA
jgi:hypothetical protein